MDYKFKMNALPLIAQEGVHHKVLGRKGTHNAIWNFVKSPDDHFYFSLCSEEIEASFARLYEYDVKNDRFDLLFRTEDIILPAERTIRPSKIHTSISFLPNGHLLMANHTTDRSPVHPFWMPYSYYSHPWEGYPGSNLIEYDPVTKKAWNLGIPVPFETIYGGIYIKEVNRYYFTGFFRGHLYSYDLETKAVRDFGQVTECGCFLLHEGPDKKIYWSTRSGYICRLDPKTDKIETLQAQFGKNKDNPFTNQIRRLDYVVNLDETHMVMAAILTDGLYLFDTETDTLTNLGSYGAELLPEDKNRIHVAVYGLSMDKDKVLWYALQSCYPPRGTIMTLARWDFLHGGKPEILGTIGSTETGRVAGSISEGFIHNDVLYFADTNHATDLPGIISIDLAKFRPHMYENGGMSDDPYLDASDQQYVDMAEHSERTGIFAAQNGYTVTPGDWTAWKLWRAVEPEESPVQRIALLPDGKVCGMCEGDGKVTYFVTDGEEKVKLISAEEGEKLLARPEPAMLGQTIRKLCVPGRQYKAIVSASTPLSGGRLLVGTQDGVLGIVDGEKVFRLGRVCINGPIRALSSSADGSVAYGVGGDPCDLGSVFRYTDENGVEELGSLTMDSNKPIGIHFSFQPVCCDVSADGKQVAIGAADRLGTAYLLSF